MTANFLVLDKMGWILNALLTPKGQAPTRDYARQRCS
jgi:hypothetical protein